MTHVSDAELVRRFQRGDRDAFETFVERHQDRMFRLANAMLYASEHAADAAQEVFLRAYTGLPRFQFRAEPFTWLYRTLRHVCSEYNRRERAFVPIDPASIATDGDTADRMDVERRLERLLAYANQLPQRQRDVLLLRVFEGLSIAETARALGCRPGTVKAHLHKAMQRLRAYDLDVVSDRGRDD